MPKASDKIGAPVSNYYGTPFLRKLKDGSFVMGLGDWDGDAEVAVSAKFAAAWIKEFGPPKPGGRK